MTSKLLLFGALFTIAFMGCKKKPETTAKDPVIIKPQPTACFSASKRFIRLGDSVHFVSCATDFKKLEWKFGDGSRSGISSPAHAFKDKGIYTVSLLAINGNKYSRRDTTIYCGMEASVTFSFSFTDRDFPAHWPSSLFLAFQTFLHKYPDSLTRINSWVVQYHPMYYNGTHVVRVPLDESGSSDFLGAKLSIEGHTTGPDPNIDYVIMEHQGFLHSDTFGVLTAPKPNTRSFPLKDITINYTVSPISYE